MFLQWRNFISQPPKSLLFWELNHVIRSGAKLKQKSLKFQSKKSIKNVQPKTDLINYAKLVERKGWKSQLSKYSFEWVFN